MIGLAVHRCGIGPGGGGVTYTPPLDGYTTSLWGAWSTRQLFSSHTGNVIRVQRSSDSTQQDIGTSGGQLDESALTSFVGANDGYIVTYYDQSGNGRNLTSVNTNQKIVSSGTIQRLGPFAANYHSGSPVSGGYLSSTRPSGMLFFNTANTSDSQNVVITRQASEATNFRGVWQNGSSSSHAANNCIVNNTFADPTRDTFHDAVAIGSDVCLTVASTSTTWTSPSQFLVHGYNSGGFDFTGYWLDAVMYSDALMSDRAAVDSALRADL